MEQTLRKYNDKTDFSIIRKTMVEVGSLHGFGHGTGKLYSVRKALEDAGVQPPPTESLDALITVAINIIRDTDAVLAERFQHWGIDEEITLEEFTEAMRDEQ